MIDDPTDAAGIMPMRRVSRVRSLGRLSFGLLVVGLVGFVPFAAAMSPTSPAWSGSGDGVPPAPVLGFQNVASSPELGFQDVAPVPKMGFQDVSPTPDDGRNQLAAVEINGLNPGASPEVQATMFPASVEWSSEESLGTPAAPESSEVASGDLNWTAPQSATDFGNVGDPWGTSGVAALPGTVGGRSSGFSGAFNGMPAIRGFADDVFDGLGFSVALTGTYDTNPSQGYSSSKYSGEGDFFATLGGSAAYRSKASEWTFGTNYSGSYSEYFSQSELSGYNQSAGGSVNYQGGPLSASFTLGVNFGSGANRYYESVVDELSVNYGLSARYRYSSKTNLIGSFSQSLTNPNGDFGATNSFNLGASALWRYSPLTDFGPGVRYSRETGDTQQDRTSIGPTMTVNYKLSRKVSLNSLVGLEFTEYDNGESADPSVIAAINLNYQASRLWGMNLSLNRSTQADPVNAGEYDETTSLRVGYHRRIRRASWSLGVSYETTAAEAPDDVPGGAGDDRDYLTFDSSLGMPVFADTCNASVFVRYSDQSGGNGGESWDSFQTGFSISRSF